MKRAKYIDALRWVSLNDSPELMLNEEIAELHTVRLIANIFLIERVEVAAAIQKIRFERPQAKRARLSAKLQKSQAG